MASARSGMASPFPSVSRQTWDASLPALQKLLVDEGRSARMEWFMLCLDITSTRNNKKSSCVIPSSLLPTQVVGKSPAITHCLTCTIKHLRMYCSFPTCYETFPLGPRGAVQYQKVRITTCQPHRVFAGFLVSSRQDSVGGIGVVQTVLCSPAQPGSGSRPSWQTSGNLRWSSS